MSQPNEIEAFDRKPVQPGEVDLADKPISDMDASVVETVLAYVEGDDAETAAVYVATLSDAGLARTESNLTMVSDLITAEISRRKLKKK